MTIETIQETARTLPKGWRWARLGELCDFIRGVSFDKTDLKYESMPDYVPILRAGNIGGNLDLTNDLVWVPSTKVGRDQHLRRGDIAISMSSGSPTVVGKTAQLKEDFIGSVGAFCGIIRAKNPDHAIYIAYWLRSPDYIEWRNSQARGANIQNLRFSEFDSLCLPLPPLSEQRRIATLLTEHMAAVDQARASAKARLEAARALPAALLRQIFESEGARGWERRKLGELLQLRKDVVYPRDNPRGRATFVGLEHIESLTGGCTGAVELEMSELTGRKPRFYKNDIVYGYLRPYLNKVWVAEFDGLCSVDQYVYLVNANIAETEYVAWFMRSSTYLDRAPINTTPGQLPRIRTEEVASVEVELPPLQIQQHAASMIKERLDASRDVRTALTIQLDTINALSAALLRRAFNGEL